MRRFVGVLFVTALLVACSGGGEDAAPSTTTMRLPDVASMLWEARKHAIADVDASALSEAEAGIALELDRAYYIDYLPEAAGQAIRDPAPDGRPIVLAGTSTSFVAFVEEGFLMPHGPVVAFTVFRADRLDGRWKITFLSDGRDEVDLSPSMDDDVRAVSPEGYELLDDVVRFREFVTEHLELPDEPEFAPGSFTTGLADSVRTHKEPEPWEVNTGEFKVDSTLTERHGFTVTTDQGDLTCGVLVERVLIQHRDGKAIKPLPVLGDRSFLVPGGEYESFTWVQHSAPCVLVPPTDDDPALPFYDSFTTSVTGKPVRTA